MTDTIRRMRQDEDPRQFQRNVNALVAENAFILEDTQQTLRQEKQWLRKMWDDIRQNKTKAWVAVDSGRVVALAFAKRGTGRESQNVELGIGVNKTHRKKGLGKALMEKCIQDAKKWKAKLVWLYVLADNKPAIALYKNLGFKKVAVLPKWAAYNGKRIDKHVMVLKA